MHFLKLKDEVFDRLKDWKVMVENYTSKRVKMLRTDNGLEFSNKPFDAFCKKKRYSQASDTTRTCSMHAVKRQTPAGVLGRSS